MPTPSKREMQLEGAILGMAGYIQWGIRHNESPEAMIETLSHDIFGLLRNDECLSPRTGRYKKFAFQEDPQ